MFSVDRKYRYTGFNKAHAAMMKALYGSVTKADRSLLDCVTVGKDRSRFKRSLDRALAGESFVASTTLRSQHSGPLICRIAYIPLFGKRGTVIGVSAVATQNGQKRSGQHLTPGRKDLEREIFETEQRLRILSEASFEGIALSEGGIIFDCNDQFAALFGYGRTEPLRKDIMDLIAPESRPSVAEAISRNMLDRYDCVGLCKDGSRKLLSVRARAADIDGRSVRISIIRDITDQRRKDDILLQTQAALDMAPDAVHWVGPDAELIYVNNATCRSLGYTREELLSMRVFDIDPNFTRETWRDHWDKTRSLGVHTIQTTHIAKGGHAFPVEISINFMTYAGREFHSAFARDISERLRAQEAARASDLRMRAIVDEAPFGAHSYELLPGGDLVFLGGNRAADRILGIDHSVLVGKTIEKVFPELTRTPIPDAYREAALTGKRYETDQVDYDAGRVRGVYEIHAFQTGAMRMTVFFRDIRERKQMEAALRESEERYRLLVESSPTSILIHSGGRIVYANPAAQRLLGAHSPEELNGKDILTLVHPDFKQIVAQRAHDVLELKRPAPLIEETLIPLHGSPIEVEAMAVPFVYQDRPAVQLILNNITEQKRAADALRVSEDRLVKAQALAHVGNWEIDLRTRTIWGSDEALSVYGYDQSTHVLPLQLIQDATIPAYRTQLDVALRDLIAGKGEYDVDFQIQRHDTGAVRYIHSKAERILDDSGTPIKIRGVIQDITDRKQAEEEVRRLNVQLDHRVRERTAELEAANRELESFSYSVSHDLRAPLRGIDGWSQALIEDFSNQLNDQARTYLDRVRAESQRMGKLIDDLLKLSRLTRSSMIREQVDLSALASEITRRLRDSHPDRSVECLITPGLSCSGDPALVEIALTNLFDNAWKFTGSHPAARIEFGRTSTEGEEVFFIRDNGAGFDMKYAQKIFGVFQRMHKISEFPGTGIGLATTQRIIHRHGGRIWVEAQIEQGATFYFTL